MRVTPKDRARVERILEAVGTKFVRPQLDKDALGNRLNFAASLYAGKVQGKYQRDHGKILKVMLPPGRLRLATRPISTGSGPMDVFPVTSVPWSWHAQSIYSKILNSFHALLHE
jgi:hypothetical protein